MGDDFLDLFANLDEVNEVLQQCEVNCIEVKYHTTDMACPVKGCEGIKFPTKTKFSRHWEERHRLQSKKFLCPVAACLAECRRKSDMRTHLRTKHERDPQRVEDILIKCESVVRENRGYVDPGLFVFKGASLAEANKTVLPTVQEIKEMVPETEKAVQARSVDQEPVKKRKISLEDYQARKDIPGCTVSTQTSWRDYPSLSLPPLPDSKEELQACLAWMCNGIDQMGRAREIAKRRLVDLEGGERQRERETRRALEQRNRELEKEIQRLKERDTLFLEE